MYSNQHVKSLIQLANYVHVHGKKYQCNINTLSKFPGQTCIAFISLPVVLRI